MDLSSWSLKDLRQWCRDHEQYAGGSREEVEQRISDAVCESARLAVYFPARDCWREGTVIKVLKQDKFRMLYDDNGKETVHSLSETLVFLAENQADEFEDKVELVKASIADWTKKDLQAYCMEHSLPLQGTKADLLELVALHIAETAEPEEEEEAEDVRVEDITAGMHHLSTGYGSGPVYDVPLRTGGARKRALIVGCSYIGTDGYLAGTLPDAQNIRSLLQQQFHFPEGSIMELTDGQSDRFRQPTRHNILKGFEWLLRDVQPGDSLFFYFSGHGGEEPDPTGEEPSGYNQTICPVDYDRAGCIKDSVIHSMLVQPLPMGVTLHALIDSCHSGTVMNLPYNAVLRHGQFEDWHEEYKGRSRCWQKMTAGGLAVQFSAARHDQLALETSRKNRGRSYSCGAATYAFIQAITRHRGVWGFDIVYGELLQAMHEELQHSNYRKQEPTLSSSLQFDCMSSRVKLKL